MTEHDYVTYAAKRIIELLQDYDSHSPYTYYSYYLTQDKVAAIKVLSNIVEQVQREIENNHVQNDTQQLL